MKLIAKYLFVFILLLLVNAVLAQKTDTTKHNTIHIKKIQKDTSYKIYNYYTPFVPLPRGPKPIQVTICGKSSGEVTKSALKKCDLIDIGGWEESNGKDIILSYDLSVWHKGIYQTKHDTGKFLNSDMKFMLKQVNVGDSVVVKNVKYKSKMKGIVLLPAISLVVVNKETPIRDSIGRKQ
ncbi:MAG TPA: hypothetical protein VN922_07035 [Bacteroidia bacterium]|nr:hypothetical protein [Bacteroidia bacterium]